MISRGFVMKFWMAGAAALFLAFPSVSVTPSYRFTIIGNDGYYFYYSFDLPITPAKTQLFDKSIYQFDLHNIAVTTLGDPFQADIWFFAQALGGGIELDAAGDGDDIRLSTNGPTLFDWSAIGPVNGIVPTFRTGRYTLTDWYDTDLPPPETIHDYTLTIGLAAAAPPPPPQSVPEPASWALLVCGFGALGGVMRARRMTVRFG
jgi:hypothetical protein